MYNQLPAFISEACCPKPSLIFEMLNINPFIKKKNW